MRLLQKDVIISFVGNLKYKNRLKQALFYYVMLSEAAGEVETSPGRVPLGCNSVTTTSNIS